MSEFLDRVFPEDQCVPEKTLRIIEETLGVEDACEFIRPFTLYSGHAHVQEPFSESLAYYAFRGVYFNLTEEEYANARRALRGRVVY